MGNEFNPNHPPKNLKSLDREVEEDIKNWDLVRCVRCGRVISMKSASSIGGGMFFIHRGGHCDGRRYKPLSRQRYEEEYMNKIGL
jgi:hypothetical protein